MENIKFFLLLFICLKCGLYCFLNILTYFYLIDENLLIKYFFGKLQVKKIREEKKKHNH